ncbi:hypothetical protein Fcan01_23329 [Folsomia candida]|uniref:Uncharacterized protein n=1 Tax=Folsomia candida TaxID=158441 RepID=A0A226DAP9_FOLCA|nr:hypothetical protein Fcan01_23329 [Folsomia candida]
MPYREFRWLDDQELQLFTKNVQKISADDDDWFAAEVDIIYPPALHSNNTHNDLPLAVDKRVISEDMLSEFQKNILSKFPEIKLSKTEKLVPSFLPKTKYVCLLKNLQFYLAHGLVLKRVHRVLTAKQAALLEPYITFNSTMRSLALTLFEISFWKALNNQLHGKSIQNVRSQLDARVVTTSDQFKKLASNPAVSSVRLLSRNKVGQQLKKVNNNVAVFLLRKNRVKLDKPVFIGFTILELSKLLVYTFHYDYMGQKYGINCNLLNMDTDGFLYEVFTNNFYNDMLAQLDIFDTSNYPKDHFLFSLKNKKIPGKLQDEKAGFLIKSYASPKAKMLSLEVVDGVNIVDIHKRAKGIKKNVIKHDLSHENFKEVVLNEILTYATMNSFRSINHQMGSYCITKIGMHSFDDKRYLYSNINSYAYGSCLIPNGLGMQNNNNNNNKLRALESDYDDNTDDYDETTDYDNTDNYDETTDYDYTDDYDDDMDTE